MTPNPHDINPWAHARSTERRLSAYPMAREVRPHPYRVYGVVLAVLGVVALVAGVWG